MIVDAGIAKMINNLSSLVTTGVASSDSTDPDASDTTISGEITATEKTLSDVTTSNKTLTYKHLILSTEGNGETFNKSVIKTSDGTLYSNDLHPELEKTNTDEVVYFHKITIERGD